MGWVRSELGTVRKETREGKEMGCEEGREGRRTRLASESVGGKPNADDEG